MVHDLIRQVDEKFFIRLLPRLILQNVFVRADISYAYRHKAGYAVKQIGLLKIILYSLQTGGHGIIIGFFAVKYG